MGVVLDPRPESVLAVPPGVPVNDGAPFTAHCLRYGVGISPDGKLAATSSYAQPVVRLWDVATGKHARYLEFGKPVPYVFLTCEHPTFSPDGKTVAALCRRWSHAPPRPEKCSLVLWDAKTGKFKKSVETMGKGRSGWRTLCLTWTPDGKQIVTPSKDAVYVWDVAFKPKIVHEIACKGKYDFAISMHDRRPAVECVTVSRNDKAVEIDTWDLAEGKLGRSVAINEELRERVAPAMLNYVAAASHDARRVALPLIDGDVAVVDVSSGELIVSLPAKHQKNVSSLAFSSDDTQLASSGTMETAVKIWKLP
jgi:hypothetical protein